MGNARCHLAHAVDARCMGQLGLIRQQLGALLVASGLLAAFPDQIGSAYQKRADQNADQHHAPAQQVLGAGEQLHFKRLVVASQCELAKDPRWLQWGARLQQCVPIEADAQAAVRGQNFFIQQLGGMDANA